MCGICGFTGSQDHGSLAKMANAIVHRGPDDAGYWEGADVSLGMRRLSIVDLETGQQPVFNEDETIGVVFNGEIYDHVELRKDLEAKGHVFRTHHSDTEVLVHAYEEYGDDFLHKLNGMFAIALWDGPRKRLLLARDRAGIKPLYFGQMGGRVVFASEIKSILAHPAARRDPNFAALYHYFSFKHIPAPASAFAAIEQLRPGERAIFERGDVRREKWWTLRYREDTSLTIAQAAEQVRAILEDSVCLRMRSDVPFGAYLSGGVDSSAVVALMSRLGGQRVTTFSLVYSDDFKHKAADQDFARQVSTLYGTDHHEYVLTHGDVASSIPAVVESFDEPFSGVTSTYFVTRLISKHVKVALSGDGADELFGSYLAHRLAQPLFHFGRLRDRLGALTPEELDSLRPYHDKLDTLAQIFDRGDEAKRRASLLLWSDADKRALLTDKMFGLCADASTEGLIRATYDTAGTADPLNRALNCDFNTLLPDQVLAFVDRLSMAHSVEVRPPFLDYRLMELSATIPGEMKIHRGRQKHVLKEAVRGLIPEQVIERPKEGFVLPIDEWLVADMRPFVEDLLSPTRLGRHGLVRPERVRLVLDEHYARKANHGARIWNLIMFQSWWERYVG